MPTAITKTKANTNDRPSTCVPSSVNVRSCLSFDALWKEHPLNWPVPEAQPYRDKNQKPVYQDQCAIKMSIALQRGGLPLTTFKGASERCGKDLPRCALRAEDLAIWLIKALGKPEIIKGGDNAADAVMGRKGIVFFKDFWTRGEPPHQERYEDRSGDHLDLWNGSRLPNKAVYGTLVATLEYGHYFTQAREVWFWELK